MSVTNLLEFKHRKGVEALQDAGKDFRIEQAYLRMKRSNVIGASLDNPYEGWSHEQKQHLALWLAVSHAQRQSLRGEL
jgi:hypothetical protein